MILVVGLAGVILSYLTIKIFKIIPDKWLCDFGEVPNEKHKNRNVSNIQTLLILASGGSIFAIYNLQNGFDLKTAMLYACFCLVLLCCISDAKFQIIPTEFCYIIAILSLLYIRSFQSLFAALAGGIILSGVFFCLGVLGKLIYKKEALGFGDVYFAAALGLYHSYFYSLTVFALALFIAAIYFIILKLLNKTDLKDYSALGPFIGIAFIISVTFKGQIVSLINWYISLLK